MSEEVALQFQGPCQVREIAPLGRGHINDTFLVCYHDGPDRVLQRLNTFVFPQPQAVMENILRVSRHLRSKAQSLPAADRRYLDVILTHQQQPLHVEFDQQVWRMYGRVQPVTSYDQLQTPQQAFFVGRSFADFQAQLVDLPGPRLHETIRDFHHTPRRLKQLIQVAEADPLGRRESARAELDFALERESRLGHLLRRHELGEIPERVTHNDTKLNNLLFDEHGQEPLCVVDLDTVMPGLVHYDFGDMVRTGCATCEEDEPDPERVDFDRSLFSELARGYLEGGRDFLTLAEVEELAFSAVLMTLEVGIRFLTDYLAGDCYFKVHHPQHNLQRARAQFALVRRLERAEAELRDRVLECWTVAHP